MNHPGEIAPLAALAAPTVALVNNAQREHQEFMADVADVSRARTAPRSPFAPEGVAVFPADDAHTPLWRELAGARRVLTFALDRHRPTWSAARHGRGWCARADHACGTGAAFALRIAGRHNAKNALAAAACAIAAGCPIDAVRRASEAFAPVKSDRSCTARGSAAARRR